MTAHGPTSSGSPGSYTPNLWRLRAGKKYLRENVSRAKFARLPKRSFESGSGNAEDPALAFRGKRKTGTGAIAADFRADSVACDLVSNARFSRPVDAFIRELEVAIKVA
jgi:hypothetical protein